MVVRIKVDQDVKITLKKVNFFISRKFKGRERGVSDIPRENTSPTIEGLIMSFEFKII